MSSLIPGYEYDIFISYRQKDNKYDGWVTKFVSHLEDELEATFKENISVYFDENPHDGLKDHNLVRDSLNVNLKSLIFLPILSQTYCDPKCYAWQYEFLAFLDLASSDSLGLKAKKGNNVSSRILPILIHELEREDIILFENEMGGIMRSIDFIYKSSGVNRALRDDDGYPSNNTFNLNYRDQINKVANAIKEIILGLKEGVLIESHIATPNQLEFENTNNSRP